MRKNKSMRLSAVALIAVTAQAFAQSSDASKPVAHVDDLARVQADRLMFRAQADRLEAQTAYTDKLPKSQASVLAQDSPAPNLTRIMAVNGVATGTFVYPDGITVEKAEGEKMPGGYTVQHLWPTKLSGELTDRKGKTIEIGMSAKQQQPAPVAAAAPVPAPFLPAGNAMNAGNSPNSATYVRVPAINPVAQ